MNLPSSIWTTAKSARRRSTNRARVVASAIRQSNPRKAKATGMPVAPLCEKVVNAIAVYSTFFLVFFLKLALQERLRP